MTSANVPKSMKIWCLPGFFSESWLDLRNFETAKTESIETVNRLSRGVTHEFDNVCALDTNDGNLLICSRGVSKGKMASIDL